MKNPNVRLILRAILAGVTALLVQIQGSTTWDASLIKSAIVGAVLAAVEYTTSLNPTVGFGKTDQTP